VGAFVIVSVMSELETMDAEREPLREDDEAYEGEGGSGASRWLVGIGAAILIAGMFLTWYHVVRPNGFAEDTTGWQTFTKLRFAILAGGVLSLLSVVLVPTRIVLIGRTLVGLVIAALVVRRIVSPPDLPGSTVTAQLGIYISLLGAVGIVFGGLFGGGIEDEDEDAYEPGAGEPVGALPPAPGEVVDAEPVDGDDPDAARLGRESETAHAPARDGGR
jgi:MFS family permease